MADRVGVINKGELILVEEKKQLMKKLGKKQLTLASEGADEPRSRPNSRHGASSSRTTGRNSCTPSTANSSVRHLRRCSDG